MVVITQVPAPTAVTVEPNKVQIEPGEEVKYETAPVPEPPDVLRVAVDPTVTDPLLDWAVSRFCIS